MTMPQDNVEVEGQAGTYEAGGDLMRQTIRNVLEQEFIEAGLRFDPLELDALADEINRGDATGYGVGGQSINTLRANIETHIIAPRAAAAAGPTGGQGSEGGTHNVAQGGSWIAIRDPSGSGAAFRLVYVWGDPWRVMRVWEVGTFSTDANADTDSRDRLEQIFGVRQLSQIADIRYVDDATWRRSWSEAVPAGDISDLMDQTEDLMSMWERERDAVLGTELASWIEGDEHALSLLATMTAEGADPEAIRLALSRTDAFARRFQAIDQFYGLGMGIQDAVDAYKQYEFVVRGASDRYLGGREISDADMAEIIRTGSTVEDINRNVQAWDSVQQYQGGLEQFNQVYVNEFGGTALNQQDFFNLMRGVGPSEVYEVFETWTAFTEARQYGLELTTARAQEYAQGTEGSTSRQEFRQAFSRAAATLYEVGLDRFDLALYGINEEDMTRAALGLAPKTEGRTIAQVEDAVQTLMAQIAEDAKGQVAAPYTGFNERGQPTLPGITRL